MAESKTTLLIVDDEETIHKALKRTLRREPYDLLHAYDAAEASALLEQRDDITAVLCDHYMPGTHGLDLLIEIRNRYPKLVTVLLTAQADLELVMSALNDGHIHRFMTKPWDPDSLRGQLRKLIFSDIASLERPCSDRAAKAEDKLREELMPMRDTQTGAFIIDPDEFE